MAAWPVPTSSPRRSRASPLIGCFGHINESKRVPQLALAFERLRRRIPAARLLLVGAVSPRLGELKLPDGVLREEYVPEERLWALMAACDACVSLRAPTMGETSAVAVRALSVGKPLVVSDVGWFRELPDDVAIKVPVGDGEIEALEAALERAAASPEMGVAALRLAETGSTTSAGWRMPMLPLWPNRSSRPELHESRLLQPDAAVPLGDRRLLRIAPSRPGGAARGRVVANAGHAGARPRADVALYHVGNDAEAHGWIVEALRRRPGVVVLHDFVLHHLVVGLTFGRGDMAGYLSAMEREAGLVGRLLGYAVLDNKIPPLWETRTGGLSRSPARCSSSRPA